MHSKEEQKKREGGRRGKGTGGEKDGKVAALRAGLARWRLSGRHEGYSCGVCKAGAEGASGGTLGWARVGLGMGRPVGKA